MSKKIIDRYNKQKDKDTSRLLIEDDPIDSIINSHLKVREQFKQEQEAEKQQKKELDKLIQEQVIKKIEEIFE